MSGAHPAEEPPGFSILAGRSNLVLRIVSSLVLAPVAIAAAWFGGVVFVAFWAIAAVIVLWEWQTLVCGHDRNSVLTVGAAALIGAAAVLIAGWFGTAIALIALGGFAIAALASRERRGWCVAGLVYAAAILIAPVLLRRDASFGFAAIMLLFVIVWLTDIAAYFAGRAIGGPKLMPRVSPKKTWSGAVGGTLAGVLGAVGVAHTSGVASLAAVAGVALVISVVSQARRPAGIRDQAAVQHQGREPADPRSWRADGPAGRVRHRGCGGGPDRAGAWRSPCPRPRPHGMVSDASR